MVPPGYPPPGPYPYGYPPPPPPGIPPNTGYPEQSGPPQPPTYPPYYPAGYPTPRPRGSSGTALIVSLYAYLFDGTTTLCLMLNLKQGHCYTASGTAENPQFDAADCNGSATVIRVAKRVDGSADVALCPAGTKPISYPTPARLYCLERLEN